MVPVKNKVLTICRKNIVRDGSPQVGVKSKETIMSFNCPILKWSPQQLSQLLANTSMVQLFDDPDEGEQN